MASRIKRQRKMIACLTAGCAFLGVTAVAVPVWVAALKAAKDQTPVICTITFSAGEHGTLVGDSTRFVKTGSRFAMADATQPSPEKGWAFYGWMMPNGTRIDDNTIVSSDITLVASYVKSDVKIVIDLDCSQYAQYGGYVDQPSYNFDEGTKWKLIKNSIPNPRTPTIEGTVWSFQYWYIDDGTLPEVIDDEYSFTKDTTLKPYFIPKSEEVTELPIRFHLISDEQHSQYKEIHDTVSLEQTANYIEAEEPGEEPLEVHTFSEVKKPNICEPGKAFSKWYRSYNSETGVFSNEWKDTDKLTPKDIVEATGCIDVYAECITVYTDPVITFVDNGETELTWIGNQEIRCRGNSVDWNDIQKPYVFKQIQGRPETGFSSPYYFLGWYYTDEEGVETEVPQTITKSMSIYPKFKAKPTIRFELDDAETPKLSDPVPIDVNATWGEVVPPGVATSTKPTNIFMGWSVIKKVEVIDPETGLPKRDPETGEVILEDKQCLLENIELLSSLDTEKHILPMFSDSCNKLEFADKASKDGSLTETVDVRYTGNPVVGTDKTQDVSFYNTVNKPVPQAQKKDPETEKYYDIYNYSFDNEWQYSTDGTTWTKVPKDYKIMHIETGQDPTTTYIRPILNSTKKITYKPNGGKLKAWKEGEEVVDTIYTKPNVPFSDLYKPTVEYPSDPDMQFMYWATKTETEAGTPIYTEVPQGKCFDADTDLYAVFDDKPNTVSVNFKLTAKDIEAGATISGASVAVNRKKSEDPILFKNLAKGVPTLAGYVLDGWTYDEAGKKPVGDDDEMPFGTTVVYAKLKPDSRYNKVSVKKPTSGEYIIEGESEIYVASNNALPVSIVDGSLMSNGKPTVKIKKIGSEIIGWKQVIDGKETILYHKKTDAQEAVDPVKVTSALENIVPIFADNVTRQVQFANKDNAEYKFDELSGKWPTVPHSVPYQTNIYDYITALGLKPSKDDYNHVGWEYSALTTTSGEDKWYDLSSDMALTSDIKIRPKFISKPAFQEGDFPYFLNEVTKKYGQITSFDDPNYLEVYYAGQGTEHVEKSTFNYQVLFPTKPMDSIPNNFMAGCTAWNNGGQPLDINIEKVSNIGKNFLADCVSFNQNVTITTAQQNLTVGDNFMSRCYSFNKNVTIKTTCSTLLKAKLTFNNGFMFECRNFICDNATSPTSGVLDISTFKNVNDSKGEPSDYYYCLSSFDAKSKISSSKFVLKVYNGLDKYIPSIFVELKGVETQPYRARPEIKYV